MISLVFDICWECSRCGEFICTPIQSDISIIICTYKSLCRFVIKIVRIYFFIYLYCLHFKDIIISISSNSHCVIIATRGTIQPVILITIRIDYHIAIIISDIPFNVIRHCTDNFSIINYNLISSRLSASSFNLRHRIILTVF